MDTTLVDAAAEEAFRELSEQAAVRRARRSEQFYRAELYRVRDDPARAAGVIAAIRAAGIEIPATPPVRVPAPR